jgi:hypothetical protein
MIKYIFEDYLIFKKKMKLKALYLEEKKIKVPQHSTLFFFKKSRPIFIARVSRNRPTRPNTSGSTKQALINTYKRFAIKRAQVLMKR